ncbi:NADH:flavin oxidoreductase [Aldersonia kunmingensis]|uniref:NADH:flavin oxidoreductase n=1 Tax=Aldersonia kunmingensis TaxID=408066 RepID=UPI00082AAE19|nr:NADH:flavin oxidoreductase [Aldersonia kunmingensis]
MTDILAPAKLGPLQLRNRIIKAATFEGRTPDSLVTDDLIEFHREMAAGGVGMTTMAYCAVSPEGRTDRHAVWMRDEALPGLRRLADAVHNEGAAMSAQLGHAGPVANAASNRAKAYSAGYMFNPLGMRITRKAKPADIHRIVAAHADAARMAESAGFDCVELHFGHNYLVSSFLSPALNHRRDAYGGSLENRARVAREVARAVRDAVGGRLAITAKLNMTDGYRGGLTIEDSVTVARWLESDGTLDAIELTAGSSLMNPMYLFHGDAPAKEFAAALPIPQRWGMRLIAKKFLREYPYRPAYLLENARKFREALDMPLILLGGITDRESMDLAMDEGFDFVAMGRALLMEPDLINRIAADSTTLSSCIHCNRCMPTIYTRTHCVLTEPALRP